MIGSPSSRQVEVLLALCVIYRREGSVTMRDIAIETPYTLATVHADLTELRNLGLVDWEDGKHRTLRPLVEMVASGPY